MKFTLPLLCVAFLVGYCTCMVKVVDYQGSVYAAIGEQEISSPLHQLKKDLHFDPEFYNIVTVSDDEEEQEVQGKGKLKGYLVEFSKFDEVLKKHRLLRLFFTQKQYFNVIKRTVLQSLQ